MKGSGQRRWRGSRPSSAVRAADSQNYADAIRFPSLLGGIGHASKPGGAVSDWKYALSRGTQGSPCVVSDLLGSRLPTHFFGTSTNVLPPITRPSRSCTRVICALCALEPGLKLKTASNPFPSLILLISADSPRWLIARKFAAA